MEPGKSYSRRTRRGLIKVTVLDSDPDKWGKGRVLVRVEQGVSTGREVAVLCRDITDPWNKAPDVPVKGERKRLVVLTSRWPPAVGDPVRIKGRDQLEWLITSISGDDYVLETEVDRTPFRGPPRARADGWIVARA